MRRAITSVLLCWAVAAQGEEWQSKLTPPVLGASPPMRLLHARYRFGWSKFEAATGPGRLNAVIVTADPATGKATAIERLNLSAQEVEVLAGATPSR